MRRTLPWIFGLALALAGSLAACERPGGAETPQPPAVGTPKAETPSQQPGAEGNPVVVIKTNKGEIRVELMADKAPITVKNFLAYADEGFYDGTIFHRVIPGFMIQGGGFDKAMEQKATKAPIKNEADNGLKNDRGTLAMARTSQVDSATAQFFINLTNNDFLNHGERDFGYAVFAKVVGGMDVVDEIAKVRTGRQGPHEAVPTEPVVIESVKRTK